MVLKKEYFRIILQTAKNGLLTFQQKFLYLIGERT